MKSLSTIISEIHNKEDQISRETSHLIDEAYQMTLYLNEMLHTTREQILKEGFANEADEINFSVTLSPIF